MDSGKWTILTPILVALIPVVAGIVSTVVNAPSPDKPVVTIDKVVPFEESFMKSMFHENSTSEFGQFEINNIGGAPATNITVFVESKSLILTAQQSSVINITLPQLNNSAMPRNEPQPINQADFQFRIPKLIQGDGGIIKVELWFDESQTLEEYNEVAIYDQGSAIGKTKFAFDLFYFWIFIITATGETLFIVYLYLILWKKRFIKYLLKNLLRIRRALLTDRHNNQPFEPIWRMKVSTWLFGRRRHIDIAWTKKLVPKFIKNVSDFIKVDDTLDLISRREDKLSSDQINDLNARLLNNLNDALEHVDWTKYK